MNIGKLGAVVPDSLRFCFGIATRELDVESIEIRD
jgi:hypothetical protein